MTSSVIDSRCERLGCQAPSAVQRSNVAYIRFISRVFIPQGLGEVNGIIFTSNCYSETLSGFGDVIRYRAMETGTVSICRISLFVFSWDNVHVRD